MRALGGLGVCLVILLSPGRARAQEAWADWTASPRPVEAASLPTRARAALAACGPGDAGLNATARSIAARKARGLPMPDAETIATLQRAAGEPHPWARAWAASGGALEAPGVLQELQRWLGEGALRRCGAAEAMSPDGARVVVVVAADALADLAALPTRSRVGQWLTVEARMRVPAGGGRVVVLGPDGSPRTVPTSFDGRTLRARFAPPQAGETTVQVMADVAGGPRPVLEATVFADAEPHTDDARGGAADDAAPSAAAAGTDEDRLLSMIEAARSSSGLPPVARDARLDGVARDHAIRILAVRALAHDAGDGDPMDRVRAAGVEAREVGENVARGPTVELAHRATWTSPAHRANLLGRYTRVGVAVARDGKGDAWIVEEMAR
jgi:uncharacterized protein YkwD